MRLCRYEGWVGVTIRIIRISCCQQTTPQSFTPYTGQLRYTSLMCSCKLNQLHRTNSNIWKTKAVKIIPRTDKMER